MRLTWSLVSVGRMGGREVTSGQDDVRVNGLIYDDPAVHSSGTDALGPLINCDALRCESRPTPHVRSFCSSPPARRRQGDMKRHHPAASSTGAADSSTSKGFGLVPPLLSCRLFIHYRDVLSTFPSVLLLFKYWQEIKEKKKWTMLKSSWPQVKKKSANLFCLH